MYHPSLVAAASRAIDGDWLTPTAADTPVAPAPSHTNWD